MREYVVKFPGISGYDIKEAKKATHAVIVRHSLSDTWKIFCLCDGKEAAEKVITEYEPAAFELTVNELQTGVKKPRKWKYRFIVPVLGTLNRNSDFFA